jgi:hypothetical protein
MKSISLTVLLFITTPAFLAAQSHSFNTLKKKFSASENVHSFRSSGFMARTVLWIAGERDFIRAIKEVKNIRLMTIPKSAFAEQALSVAGFKKVLRKDSYEELALISDHSDAVGVYLQSNESSNANRYFILIDNPREVVAVELKGYIDPEILQARAEKLTHTN